MPSAHDVHSALPLEALRAIVERCASGGRPPVASEADARRLGLPIATLRGSLSAYSATSASPDAAQVCMGTSCMLADAASPQASPQASLAARLGAAGPVHSVHCLGFCDRSPAAVLPDGHIILEGGRATSPEAGGGSRIQPPDPPDVRCAAPRAIVTRRLLPEGSGAPSSGGVRPDEIECPPYEGLAAALRLSPHEVVEEIAASDERGRGGAAFPTAVKWRMAAGAHAPSGPASRVVVANGDEGDPGCFIDRELMERDPHAVLEGMAICAHAIGAELGVVFIRAEYPRAAERMRLAVDAARLAGRLGDHALGHDRGFHVRVVRGLGSYVCGEETALIAALEGHRPEARPRPPFPAESGLFGMPTVVDNVETLVNVPWILRHGAAAYAALGTPESRGTKALCLAKGFARPGIVEVEFGTTLREVIERHAGGGADGRPIEAVLMGGPMGSLVGPDRWDAPICYGAMARAGLRLGHGGLVPILAPADWHGLLLHLVGFLRRESCGRCVPCGLGSARADELVREPLDDVRRSELESLLALMREASLCAFGREAPGPIADVLARLHATPRASGGGA